MPLLTTCYCILAYDSGGGWRQERDTTPKARGASQVEEENEQRVHGGRLERRGPPRRRRAAQGTESAEEL